MVLIVSRAGLLGGRIGAAAARRYATGSSSSSTRIDMYSRSGGKKKAASEEATHPDLQFYTDKPEYPPIVPQFGATGPEALKVERKEFAEFLKSLPTVQEKIFLVNPYERPWEKSEKTWHRDYMHPQWDPRPVFRVHAVPEHYNLLPFYQYITNTHCISGLPLAYYDRLNNIDRHVEEFVSLALELIRNEQQSWVQRQFSSTDYSRNVADQLVDAASLLFSSQSEHAHLADAQVNRGSSLQMAWSRGGFDSLYPADDQKPVRFLDPNWGKEIFGDDRRKLGEFAFCLREKLSLSIRNRLPIPEVVSLNDSLCRSKVEPYVYAPLTVGLFPDKDGPTYLTPGYEYGDEHEFNSVIFYPIDSVLSIISKHKGANPKETYEECLRSASLALAFATLNGQAHYLGFTQYNDLTYPLTTQIVLTDGQFWHFCVYQLNSISLKMDTWRDDNEADQPSPANLAWCSGSMKLYDSVDSSSGQFQGVNKDVLKVLLQFLFLGQEQTKPEIEMRPYLLKKETADENALKAAQTQAEAIMSVRE